MRRRSLVVLGAAVVIFDLALVFLDRKMQAAGGPSILGFELAGSPERAVEVMAEWGAPGQTAARWSLWIDFGFMVSYGAFFTLAALALRDYAAARGFRRFALAGSAAAAAATAAAIFDAAENVLLLLVLGGSEGESAPVAASLCATVKFLLIGLSIVYAISGLTLRVLNGPVGVPSSAQPRSTE